MRTLILSDIHMGPDGTDEVDYNIFAGADALPPLLDSFVSPPTRVFLNGDTVDFLMNEDMLTLDPNVAARQAHAIANARSTKPVFEALGRILAGGGEVIVRIGNHDIELALGEVQQVFRDALGQPPEVAARMTFMRGEQPEILEVNGARLLLTHGEQNDRWNYIDWAHLPGPGGPEVDPESFQYPPGSMLVKGILNPAKRVFRMRFADLLKPDFQGAVLTALAVDYTAVSMVWQRSTADLLALLAARDSGPVTFLEDEEKIPRLDEVPELGLADLLAEANLDDEEKAALDALFTFESGPDFFGEETVNEVEPSMWGRLSNKLSAAGLRRYARMHRKVAAPHGQAYFELEPTDEEWAEARRLAEKFDADAVIIGHTHSARFRAGKVTDDSRPLTYINTGTWIWLMRLPEPPAPDDADWKGKLADMDWEDYIKELRENPTLNPAKATNVRLETRFTAALALPHPQGGAMLQLLEWRPGEGVVPLGNARVPAR
ncbi:MAG: hypothetical protein H6739_06155 [Alphaproteobacteria bacterium]|nr:hypothetical protein [Alphaproteobacteria bacterium]